MAAKFDPFPPPAPPSFTAAALPVPLGEQLLRDRWVSSGWEMSDTAPGKRRAEPQQEESCRKRKDGSPTSVTVELEVLDCPVCYEPLRPPIFQVHSLCPKVITSFSFPLLQSPFVSGRTLRREFSEPFGQFDNAVLKMFSDHLILFDHVILAQSKHH